MREGYQIPDELVRHAPGLEFAPGDLRAVCRKAGEGLGREDAAEARFRSAAAMVALWRGLDLPAWEAPYVLRDARLGYLNGYEYAWSPAASPQRIRIAPPKRVGVRVGASDLKPPDGGPGSPRNEGI